MEAQRCSYMGRLPRTIGKTRIKEIWKQASNHRCEANLAEGADVSVAQRHYKQLIHAGKHGEAGTLMTICTGACWSPARLLEEGIIPQEEAVCPLCGEQGADEGHLYWECPKVLENPHPAIQKTNKFCSEYYRYKADPKKLTLYWRGLVSEQETTPMDPILETEEPLGDIHEYSGTEATIYTDGSGGKRSKDKRLRRCG